MYIADLLKCLDLLCKPCVNLRNYLTKFSCYCNYLLHYHNTNVIISKFGYEKFTNLHDNKILVYNNCIKIQTILTKWYYTLFPKAYLKFTEKYYFPSRLISENKYILTWPLKKRNGPKQPLIHAPNVRPAKARATPWSPAKAQTGKP